jgi:hypothetical protein
VKYQLCAYVRYGRATVLSMSDRLPVIEVEVVNSGQTPASTVEVGTRHYLGRRQAHVDLQGGGTRTRILGIIGPMQRRCAKVEYIDPLPAAGTKPFVLSVVVAGGISTARIVKSRSISRVPTCMTVHCSRRA